jgi:hypothetical protein
MRFYRMRLFRGNRRVMVRMILQVPAVIMGVQREPEVSVKEGS